MKHIFRRLLLVLVCLGISLGLCSCIPHRYQADNLTAPYKLQKSPQGEITDSGVLAAYALALSLITYESTPGENQLLSSLSVMLALGMTANGANGETQAQMERVLGLSVEELNVFLLGVLQSADQDILNLAQSIWFRDNGFAVKETFLDTNANYFDADAFAAKFDKSTVADINAWVSEETQGMIEKLLDSIRPEDMMYLISALAFEADWAEKYNSAQIKQENFTTADGTLQKVEMMSSSESFYLSQGGALGVLKYYEGERYAFAGILPPEGISPEDYLASLSAEDFAALLGNVKRGIVSAKIPAFSFTGNYELSQALSALGMPLAFSPDADFSGIADQNLSVSEVKHKTFIDVNPDGTRAAAVTSIGIKTTSIGPSERICVYLNRPFVMVLLDTDTGLPLFVGIINTVK